jgi:hypothetical protein
MPGSVEVVEFDKEFEVLVFGVCFVAVLGWWLDFRGWECILVFFICVGCVCDCGHLCGGY